MTRSTTVVAAIAVLLAVAGVAAGGLTHGQQPTGTITVGEARGTPGERVSVPVWINGSDVAAYETNVSFDPTIVQVEAIEGGAFGTPIANVNNNAGWIRFTQSESGGYRDPIIARIRFTVVGSPGESTPLDVNETQTKVFDRNTTRIGLTAVNAGRIVVIQPKTSTSPPAPSVTSTPPSTSSTATAKPTPTSTPTATATVSSAAPTTTNTAPNSSLLSSDLLQLVGAFALGGLLVGVLLIGRRLRS